MVHAMTGLDTALWDNLPVAAVVLETTGTIRHANQRVFDFAGHEPCDLVGTSLFDLIVYEDLVSIMDSMDHVDGFEDVVLGPFRVRYIQADGGTNWCEAWAMNTTPSLGVPGWVVTMSVETCAARLATALHGIASDAELGASLTTVAAAVGTYPIVADATFIIDRPDGRMDLWGSKPFADLVDDDFDDHGWRDRPLSIDTIEIRLDELSEPIRSRARAAGYHRLWTRTVVVDGIDRGVMLAWRRLDVAITPNQRKHLDDCLDVASLAIGRNDHRQLLRAAAYTDHLTGLGNRALLERHSADESSDTSSVLFIDIDDFKNVNDRHGHAVGDALLRYIGSRLARVCGPNGNVYRIGGDEFVVVCGANVDEQTTRELAQRLVTAVAEPVRIDGLLLKTAVSIGVATGAGGASVATLTERADRALIRAKRSGKGRWSDDSASSIPERLSHAFAHFTAQRSPHPSMAHFAATRRSGDGLETDCIGHTDGAPLTSD